MTRRETLLPVPFDPKPSDPRAVAKEYGLADEAEMTDWRIGPCSAPEPSIITRLHNLAEFVSRATDAAEKTVAFSREGPSGKHSMIEAAKEFRAIVGDINVSVGVLCRLAEAVDPGGLRRNEPKADDPRNDVVTPSKIEPLPAGFGGADKLDRATAALDKHDSTPPDKFDRAQKLIADGVLDTEGARRLLDFPVPPKPLTLEDCARLVPPIHRGLTPWLGWDAAGREVVVDTLTRDGKSKIRICRAERNGVNVKQGSWTPLRDEEHLVREIAWVFGAELQRVNDRWLVTHGNRTYADAIPSAALAKFRETLAEHDAAVAAIHPRNM